MTTPSTRRSAAAFALSAAFTLAMMAGVGALFGSGSQATAPELARAAEPASTQVVVIEGKRVARS